MSDEKDSEPEDLMAALERSLKSENGESMSFEDPRPEMVEHAETEESSD